MKPRTEFLLCSPGNEQLQEKTAVPGSECFCVEGLRMAVRYSRTSPAPQRCPSTFHREMMKPCFHRCKDRPGRSQKLHTATDEPRNSGCEPQLRVLSCYLCTELCCRCRENLRFQKPSRNPRDLRVTLTAHYYAAGTVGFCCCFLALGFKAKETAQ